MVSFSGQLTSVLKNRANRNKSIIIGGHDRLSWESEGCVPVAISID